MKRESQNISIGVNKRSKQDLGCFHNTSTDFGRLDPVYDTELVPGDDVELSVQSFFRASPMPVPTFGNARLSVRFFFVPYRIMFQDANFWDNYISGQNTSTLAYAAESTIAYWLYGSGTPANKKDKDHFRLLSNLKFPPRMLNQTSAPSLPNLTTRYNLFSAMAYQLAWWDYYRDSNLIPDDQISSYVTKLSLGDHSASQLNSIFKPRYACWNKDYFTTCKLRPQSSGYSAVLGASSLSPAPNPIIAKYNQGSIIGSDGSISSTSSGISYDLFIRAAHSLQKYLERNNIAGGRFIERALARYGVAPSRKTLGQSQYIGSFVGDMRIGDVTSNISNGKAPSTPFGKMSVSVSMGELGGKSIASTDGKTIKFHAEEFGTLIGISTLIPDTGYFQGIPRSLTRGTMPIDENNPRFDFFTPEMEGIGMQPVFNRELAALNYSDDDSDIKGAKVFGFAPRYGDYKFHDNTVSGDLVLKGTYTGMSSYHLYRIFEGVDGIPDSNVILNPSFTQITPQARLALDRIFTVQGSLYEFDHFNGFHDIKCDIMRPMDGDTLPELEYDRHDKIQVSGGSQLN